MTATTITVEQWRKFDTFAAAYRHARDTTNDLIRNGQTVIVSRLFQDRFKSARPRSPEYKLMGVTPKAGIVCAQLAPGGHWWVNCEKSDKDHHQFMAWYSKYLPYAYGMMMAEDHFPVLGINYESINSYYGTCGGFISIGQGELSVELPPDTGLRLMLGQNASEFTSPQKTANVIEQDDLDLYDKIYQASMQIRSPGLPFYEAWQPAFCFVAFRRPELFAKHVRKGKRWTQEDEDGWRTKHVRAVAEELKLDQPKFK